MQFCKTCGGLMVPSETGKSLVCPACGVKGKIKEPMVMKEEMKHDKTKKVMEKDIADTMPISDAECEKCGNKKAYTWESQTRAADEPETQFFRCTKCRFTWREYL
jgi:DNA-directed RNA polymerase subunit M